MTVNQLHVVRQLLQRFGGAGIGRCLIVGYGARPTAADLALLPEGSAVDWIDGCKLADLDGNEEIYSLAVVRLQPIEARAAAELLGRLRDRYAKRVVLQNANSALSANELRALGYVAPAGSADSETLYVYDPDEFFARRDWNNADDWANPENFSRYRW